MRNVIIGVCGALLAITLIFGFLVVAAIGVLSIALVFGLSTPVWLAFLIAAVLLAVGVIASD